MTRLSNQYCRLSEQNGVRRACFNYLVALARGREAVDQDARAADGNNAADVWLHSVDQRTSMEISGSSPGGFATDQDIHAANARR
jgi:hypothetical protein